MLIRKNDVIILKAIAPLAMTEFDGLVSEARKQVKKAGLKPADISDAVKKVRRQK